MLPLRLLRRLVWRQLLVELVRQAIWKRGRADQRRLLHCVSVPTRFLVGSLPVQEG